MPRKSSVSPPGTRRCCQELPSSSERRTTPLEPQAQTTDLRADLDARATEMPRRFESALEVKTFHCCAEAEAATSKNRIAKRMGRILAANGGNRRAMGRVGGAEVRGASPCRQHFAGGAHLQVFVTCHQRGWKPDIGRACFRKSA